MKRILSFTLLLLTLCLSFTSCDKNDDPQPEPGYAVIWHGDWNNPNDPLNPYKNGEYYNPLEGTWWYDQDITIAIAFREDFTFMELKYDYSNPNEWQVVLARPITKYIINDLAIKLKFDDLPYENVIEYKTVLEDRGLMLMMRIVLPTVGEWKKYRKIIS